MATSKAQELAKLREESGIPLEFRKFKKTDSNESLDSFYTKSLSPDLLENALSEYESNYDRLTEEFLEKTRIHKEDLGFLFFATMLQCARIYIINKLTETQPANMKGGHEDALHDFQDKILGKFDSSSVEVTHRLYAPLDQIITTSGVPYDVTNYGREIKGKISLFAKANHRYDTLGHDPALGFIFGTANILTNTITTNNKLLISSNIVHYDRSYKSPNIGLSVRTSKVLQSALKRLENDKPAFAAAIIKQGIHILTDAYTPCGIQLPVNLILSRENISKLTEYISTGDILKFTASASMSMLINTIISAIHGCTLIFKDDGSDYSANLYQARTRKILMYSNIIASGSNLITTAVAPEASKLDFGGLAVTIYRIFNDTKFIRELEYEFINSSLDKIYDSRYEDVMKYYT